MPLRERVPPKRFFQGREFGRLMSMMLMLVVLGMMIQTARNPQTWTWLVGSKQNAHTVGDLDKRGPQRVTREDKQPEPRRVTKPMAEIAVADGAKPAAENSSGAKRSDDKGADTKSADTKTPANKATVDNAADSKVAGDKPADEKPEDEKPADKKPLDPKQQAIARAPKATGPTDEDEDEELGAIEDFDFVSDGKYNIERSDQPAYQRIMRWVINQPFERLEARTLDVNPRMEQFLANPKVFRGQIYELEVHVRRMLKFDSKFKFHDEDNPQDPVDYYEMWGTTEASQGHLMHFIVYDPPEGMPIGPAISEDVRFVGYFFRIQAYLPAKAPPGGAGELAPSFIGRITWKKVGPAKTLSDADMPILWIIIGVVAVLGAGWIGFMYFMTRQGRTNVAPTSTVALPRSVTIDDWLDGGGESAEPSEHESGGGPRDPHAEGNGNGLQRGPIGLFNEPPGRHLDN